MSHITYNNSVESYRRNIGTHHQEMADKFKKKYPEIFEQCRQESLNINGFNRYPRTTAQKIVFCLFVLTLLDSTRASPTSDNLTSQDHKDLAKCRREWGGDNAFEIAERHYNSLSVAKQQRYDISFLVRSNCSTLEAGGAIFPEGGCKSIDMAYSHEINNIFKTANTSLYCDVLSHEGLHYLMANYIPTAIDQAENRSDQAEKGYSLINRECVQIFDAFHAAMREFERVVINSDSGNIPEWNKLVDFLTHLTQNNPEFSGLSAMDAVKKILPYKSKIEYYLRGACGQDRQSCENICGETLANLLNSHFFNSLDRLQKLFAPHKTIHSLDQSKRTLFLQAALHEHEEFYKDEIKRRTRNKPQDEL
jgi:hypothetical protein